MREPKRELCHASDLWPDAIVARMNVQLLAENWALIAAAVPAFLASFILLRHWHGNTASGQLRKVLDGYRRAQKEFRAARKLCKKTTARVGKLSARVGTTKPRHLQEAKEAAEDAKSLEKIASDKVQVAANHVRRVIHEEFPPVRQQQLRERYLPQDIEDGRPFTL